MNGYKQQAKLKEVEGYASQRIMDAVKPEYVALQAKIHDFAKQLLEVTEQANAWYDDKVGGGIGLCGLQRCHRLINRNQFEAFVNAAKFDIQVDLSKGAR